MILTNLAKKTVILMTLVMVVILTIVPPSVSAHYGPLVSQYSLCGSTFEGTNNAMDFLSAEEAQAAWITASAGTILRVGYVFATPDNDGMYPIPVNDVRLVAIDGVITCASENQYGCNGF